MHEFYASLSEIVDVANSLEFEKVYVLGHVYKFSPKKICDYLKTAMHSFNEFNKTYIMDVVASELCVTKSTWPKNNFLRASELTLKYSGLRIIAINNWSSTTHYSTLSKDMATLVSIWDNWFSLILLILRMGERRIRSCHFVHWFLGSTMAKSQWWSPMSISQLLCSPFSSRSKKMIQLRGTKKKASRPMPRGGPKLQLQGWLQNLLQQNLKLSPLLCPFRLFLRTMFHAC